MRTNTPRGAPPAYAPEPEMSGLATSWGARSSRPAAVGIFRHKLTHSFGESSSMPRARGTCSLTNHNPARVRPQSLVGLYPIPASRPMRY
jgi:hypothetical protein